MAAVCAKCHEAGSLHLKAVKNSTGKTYHYEHFAHYSGQKGKTRKIKWCYIGKPRAVSREELRRITGRFSKIAWPLAKLQASILLMYLCNLVWDARWLLLGSPLPFVLCKLSRWARTQVRKPRCDKNRLGRGVWASLCSFSIKAVATRSYYQKCKEFSKIFENWTNWNRFEVSNYRTYAAAYTPLHSLYVNG